MGEREILSFRDKVGKVLASLGVGLIILGIIVFFSWFFSPIIYRSQINIVRILVVIVFAGLVLVRLSLYTIKK